MAYVSFQEYVEYLKTCSTEQFMDGDTEGNPYRYAEECAGMSVARYLQYINRLKTEANERNIPQNIVNQNVRKHMTMGAPLELTDEEYDEWQKKYAAEKEKYEVVIWPDPREDDHHRIGFDEDPVIGSVRYMIDHVIWDDIMSQGGREFIPNDCVPVFKENGELDLDNLPEYITIPYEHYVHALPIMCGSGKSEAIRYQMLEAIDNHSGILILTDNIQQLEEYTSTSADKKLKERLNEAKDNILIMTSDNVVEFMPVCHEYPVLMITTQRYIRATPVEIQQFLKWQDHERHLVLIDEKPELMPVTRITRSSFYAVKGMLLDAIDISSGDKDEKKWCVDQWDRLCKRIEAVVDTYEERFPDQQQFHLYYVDKEKKLTDDDDRFWAFIQLHSNEMKKTQFITFYYLLEAINDIITRGALYSCRKGMGYHNSFTICTNKAQQFIDIGPITIVFDGTADIHPDYNQRRIDMYFDERAQRSLEGLTINFVDVPTSRLAIKKDQKFVERMLRELEYSFPDHKPVVFTYTSIERHFSKAGYTTQHFGNIKGKNDYRNETEFVQIGLNRQPPDYYLAYSLARNPELVEELTRLSVKEADARISAMLRNTDTSVEVMYPMLLADIEQNLFRGAIRKADFTGKMTYTIYCNTKQYSELIDMVKDRYEKIHAVVNVLPSPILDALEKILLRQNGDPSKAQRIAECFLNYRMSEITIDQIKKELDCDQAYIDKAKEKNAQLRFAMGRMYDRKTKTYCIP